MKPHFNKLLSEYHRFRTSQSDWCPNYFGDDTARIALFSDLLTQPAAVFDRHCYPGHFTASGVIVNASRSQICLVFHRKLHKWLQPGGHAERDQNLFDAATREVEEETGLTSLPSVCVFESPLPNIFDLDAHWIPESPKEQGHYHYDVRFLFEADSTQPLQLSSESTNISWWSIDKARTLNSESSMHRVYDKILALK